MVLQGSLLGLAAAHARGVVHRDYKPDNVLVDEDGTSKLTDFGIAARAGDRSVRGGTLAYAPPEQFGGGSASPAGDVYAATATFFECLTGWPPFHGDTAAALMYQHLSQPVPVDAVPEPVRPLVAAGMAKRPEDRPADATAFVAVLNKVAAAAYGPDWHDRGRSHLGEAALLLAALWPSGGPAAVQGSAVEKIRLRQGNRRSRLRHSKAVRRAIAAATVAAGTILALRFTGSGAPPAVTLPAVTGVSPASGSTGGGRTVTITGTGLAGATGVRFGTAAATITADSSTQITVTSPPGAGTVTITVTTPAGTSKTSAASHFAYTTRPKPAQSISFTPPASGTPGGSAALSATGGGSGNPVVFSVDGSGGPGVCAVSGNTVTYTAAGSCVVDANQAGNGSYADAPQVQRTITVSKKPQSISFTAPTSGALWSSADLSATGGGSGNPVVFSVDPSSGQRVCRVSGATVTYTGTGKCVIDANQAGNRIYAAAPQVQQTITVIYVPQYSGSSSVYSR